MAIGIDAGFASITRRSLGPGEPPYRPPVAVPRGKSVRTHVGVGGRLVGVCCPARVGDVNLPGYHWHLRSADRTLGGRALDCRVRHDVCRDRPVTLGGSADCGGAGLGRGRRDELRRGEGPASRSIRG
ncbi:MAG TPA: acetolactate decarboxylase, partial [Isosphaeraceae bacterium]